MPPLRTERSGKACDSCRKQKTRCYPSGNAASTCLRCLTLKQRCSLTVAAKQAHSASPADAEGLNDNSASQIGIINGRSVKALVPPAGMLTPEDSTASRQLSALSSTG